MGGECLELVSGNVLRWVSVSEESLRHSIECGNCISYLGVSRGYAKQLLHPDNKTAAAAILLDLDPTKGLLTRMNKICLQNTLDSIWENNPFNDEQEYVEEAEKDIAQWMNSL
ncbi:hypothetical protein DFH06DRAFT_1329642 [Mycena polygramma]|nr:hypothetical protein DFH06DRAFT_1329642 [Mycena polygramma]